MSEEWGPWIEHDGKGCPVAKGTPGEAELRDGRVVFFRALCGSTRGGPDVVACSSEGSAWVWGSSLLTSDEVVRYRIRRPRSLLRLIEMVENLPAPSKEMEPA